MNAKVDVRTTSDSTPAPARKCSHLTHSESADAPTDDGGAFSLLSVRPFYVVAYDSTDDPEEPFEPLVVGAAASEGATWPHGLSYEMAPGLAAASYCLRLPRTLADFLDLAPTVIERLLEREHSHNIVIAPTNYLASLPGHYFASGPLAIVIAGDAQFRMAEEFAIKRGSRIGARRFSDVDLGDLANDWRLLARSFGAPEFGFDRLSAMIRKESALPALLGAQRLARQMSVDIEQPSDPTELTAAGMVLNLNLRASIRAMASIESGYETMEGAEPKFAESFRLERSRIRIPSLVLGQHGTSPKYAKVAEPNATDADGTPSRDADAATERRAIELMVAHRAAANESIGTILPDAPAAAYNALWQLESHWSRPGGPKGVKVRRALDLINKHAQVFLTEELSALVTRSRRVKAFTNFPVGLTSLASESAPMSMRIPVSQVPLAPLTRMLPGELLTSGHTNLESDYRVLIAECIPGSDRVGQLSRKAWRTVVERLMEGHKRPTFSYVETLTPDALNQALGRTSPDILVLSAHGHRPLGSNVAGIMIGDTLSLGIGLDNVPQVVLLSACSVAPRGAGDISIVDLLLREGAKAILGAAVPIDVYRNAMLMMRFFLYLNLALAGEEPEGTLLDVWHRVHCGNAVNDIITGSEPLTQWALKAVSSDSEPPLVEFMTNSNNFEVRQAHVYKDTERALISIAERNGQGRLVREWLRLPGYVGSSQLSG